MTAPRPDPEVRVLYLLNSPRLGGTNRIMQHWLDRAGRAGIRPFVVAPPGSKIAGWLGDRGVPCLPARLPWPSRRWPVPAVLAAWRVARWARRHRVQVMHCNEHNVYPFAALLRRLLPRPVVCHVRYRIDDGFAGWAFAGRKRPDRLMWTSRQQQQDCAAAVGGLVPADRQCLMPLGVDLSAFGTDPRVRDAARQGWGFRADRVVVGQSCTLGPRKRVDDFVRLVAALRRDDPRVAGVLAGDVRAQDTAYRETVRGYIADAGLGDHFRWLGHTDDMEAFCQGIDLYVSTSEYETFGNSVCEAMACGKPAIGYRGGSVAEVIGDDGLVAETPDLARLTDLARQVVADDARRTDLGREARARVAAEFDPAVTLTRLRAMYDGLLVRPGGGPG